MPLFFACPPSAHTLKISIVDHLETYNSALVAYARDSYEYIQEWDPSIVSENGSQKAHRRKEPLFALKVLRIWGIDENSGLERVQSTLRHCPNITKFTIPDTYDAEVLETFAKVVAEECPRIQSLDCFFGAGGTQDQVAYMIAEALPEQQLRDVRFFTCAEGLVLDKAMLEGALVRHSTTLSRLMIWGDNDIQSDAIQSILVGCVALEELTIGSLSQHQEGQILLLADAVEKPWACTCLKTLGLSVGILHPSYLAEDLYCIRDPPTVLNGTEVELFQSLEMLYRQIGSLPNLEELKLHGRWLAPLGWEKTNSYYNLVSFPGMLSLGDAARGRPGYLGLLGGLKKLKRLLGSVYANTEETRITMGWKEVVWIDEFWPELKVAEFFGEGEKVYKPFVWLQEQRAFNRPRLLF